MDGVLQALGGDLRLALLLLGGLLVLGIVAWELAQRRRVRRADAAHRAGPPGQPREPTTEVLAATAEDPLLAFRLQPSRRAEERREPTLGMADMPIRERVADPPLVDLDAPRGIDSRNDTIPVLESVPMATANAPITQVAVESAAGAAGSTAAVPSAADAVTADFVPAGSESSATPRVEWPSEEQRVIVSLRVLARNGERFTGASLRQALLGEGFVHGDMEIFHRPHSDGRVLLSAASLTRPGSFDLATMDSGLYLGLNLFAVLPGPLAGKDTVDKLLTVGHTLARRLRGELLSGRGEALSEARLAEMRREAAAADPR
jgi:cell division protein ZipA